MLQLSMSSCRNGGSNLPCEACVAAKAEGRTAETAERAEETVRSILYECGVAIEDAA